MLLDLAPEDFPFKTAHQHRFFWFFLYIHWTLSWTIFSDHHFWDRAHFDNNIFTWSDSQHLHNSAFETIQFHFADRRETVRPNCGVGSRFQILPGLDVQWEATNQQFFILQVENCHQDSYRQQYPEYSTVWTTTQYIADQQTESLHKHCNFFTQTTESVAHFLNKTLLRCDTCAPAQVDSSTSVDLPSSLASDHCPCWPPISPLSPFRSRNTKTNINLLKSCLATPAAT